MSRIPLIATLTALLVGFAAPAARAQDSDVARRLIERIAEQEREREAARVDRTDAVVAPDDREAAAQIRRQLQNRRITINFEEVALPEALDFVRDVSGLNIVVSAAARDEVASADRKVTLRLRDIRLRAALIFMLEAVSGELAFGVQDGVLLIALKSELRGRSMVLRVYDVSELLTTPPDFPAPKVGLPDAEPD